MVFIPAVPAIGAVRVCDEKTGCHGDPEDDFAGGPAVCVLLENLRMTLSLDETDDYRLQNPADKEDGRKAAGPLTGFHCLTAQAVGRFSSPENRDDLLFSLIEKKHLRSLQTPLWL